MNNDEVLDFSLPGDNNLPEYEIVSLNKFLLLSFLTFGLYELWWTYKSWTFFKEKESLDVNPAARTLFAIFFLTSLFEKIKRFANLHGYNASYPSGLLVIALFLLNIFSRLPHPFWIVSIVSVLCFIPPVNALNYAIRNSRQYTVIDKNGLNGRQIVLVIIAGLLWAFIIIGLMA